MPGAVHTDWITRLEGFRNLISLLMLSLNPFLNRKIKHITVFLINSLPPVYSLASVLSYYFLFYFTEFVLFYSLLS